MRLLRSQLDHGDHGLVHNGAGVHGIGRVKLTVQPQPQRASEANKIGSEQASLSGGGGSESSVGHRHEASSLARLARLWPDDIRFDHSGSIASPRGYRTYKWSERWARAATLRLLLRPPCPATTHIVASRVRPENGKHSSTYSTQGKENTLS